MIKIEQDLRKPSEINTEYWIYAYNSKNNYPEDFGDRTGKWLIFVSIKEIDEIWELVRKSVFEGKLGDSAKVATMRESPNSLNSNYKVICVYTYDYDDKKDVMRIAKELIDLGVPGKLKYKSDKATLEGKYANRGSSSIMYEATKETFYPKEKALESFF